MTLLNNYSIRNSGQSRALGGNLDPTYNFNLGKMMTFYVCGNGVVNVTDRMSLPGSGYRPPYSLVIAPKAGGVSSNYISRGQASSSTAGFLGKFTVGQSDGVATVTGAMSLIIQAIGSAGGVATVSGIISASLSAVGSSAGVATADAIISALMSAVGQSDGVATVTGTSKGNGSVTAHIFVNESQATVEQITDGILNAVAANYNNAGTIGEKINDGGSAGDPWSTDLTTYNTADTAGLLMKKASKPKISF